MKKRLTIFVLLAMLLSATINAFSTLNSTNTRFYNGSTTIHAREDFVGDLELTSGKANVKTTVTSLQKSSPHFSAHLFVTFSSFGLKETSNRSLLVNAYLSHIYPSHNFW